MQINYFGYSCFKLRSAQASVLTDPFSSKIAGFSMPKVTADIVTISHHHPGHDDITRLKGEAFIIDAPGEYEIKGILVQGINSNHDKGRQQNNLIYLIDIEGLRVCHLGDIGVMPDQAVLEKLSGVDILFTPVGGNGDNHLSIEQIIKLVSQVDPSYVIPMHYRLSGPKVGEYPSASLEEFINEYGSEGEQLERLIVNRSTLPEETSLVILKDKT